jgi:hypothetical protein
MADAYKTLGQVELAQAAATTTIYTVPGSTEGIVKHITVVNTSAGRVTFRLWRGGVADVNLITPPGAGLPKGAFWVWKGTMSMEAGDTLIGQSDTASAVSVTVDGDEVT